MESSVPHELSKSVSEANQVDASRGQRDFRNTRYVGDFLKSAKYSPSSPHVDRGASLHATLGRRRANRSAKGIWMVAGIPNKGPSGEPYTRRVTDGAMTWQSSFPDNLIVFGRHGSQ